MWNRTAFAGVYVYTNHSTHPIHLLLVCVIGIHYTVLKNIFNSYVPKHEYYMLHFHSWSLNISLGHCHLAFFFEVNKI
jgi:hypothetical protein